MGPLVCLLQPRPVGELPVFSGRSQVEREASGHRYQLDGRNASCEEEVGVGLLLRERHRSRHPGASESPSEVGA